MDSRPTLNKSISPQDFQEFYWLKEELITFCREEGLKTSGGKIEITERINDYLKTGEKPIRKVQSKPTKKSKFDWNTEKLTFQTKITDNYKNSENVRRFFDEHIGSKFKFNVQFMNWMKSNVGKNLKEALEEWIRITEEKKTNTKPKQIAPQFEYNRYLRDFMADNPAANRSLGIKLWTIKKSLRGDNVYRKEDFELMK